MLAHLLEAPPLFLFADVEEKLEDQGSSLRKGPFERSDVVHGGPGKFLIQREKGRKADEPFVPASVTDKNTPLGGSPSPGTPKGRIIGIAG